MTPTRNMLAWSIFTLISVPWGAMAFFHFFPPQHWEWWTFPAFITALIGVPTLLGVYGYRRDVRDILEGNAQGRAE